MKPPSLKKIIKAVCVYYNFKESDMKSSSQARLLSRARGEVGWLAFELGAGSLTEAAGCFGRDTATLSRIVGNINKQARMSSDYRASLEKVKRLAIGYNCIMQA